MKTLPQRLVDSAKGRVRPGPQFWRSLEELAGQRDFQDQLAEEFPEGASLWQGGPVERRQFLKLFGASLGLAGLTACSPRQRERILPYVRQPEMIVPGKPLHYATLMPWRGYARGILVESHMGRPTKIEGNPDHPFSLGACDTATQAAIAGFYDPQRQQTPLRHGVPDTWQAFEAELLDLRQRALAGEARVAVLAEPTGSPTLLRQFELLRQQWPGLRFYHHDPLAAPVDRAAYRPHYDFEKADVILAVESDFLEGQPESLAYAKAFSKRRRVAGQPGDPQMNRLYAAETAATLTGAMADHHETMSPPELVKALRRIRDSITSREPISGESPHDNFLRDAAEDLEANRGRSLIIVGSEQPVEAHRLAHQINAALSNVGQTLRYRRDPRETPPEAGPLQQFAEDAAAGAIDALIILSANPFYTAPADIDFGAALDRIGWTAQLSLEHDETGRRCRWSLPEAHFLETWSDLRAPDGTATIQQPLIEPLYQGRSAHELLSLMLGETRPSRDGPVVETWRQRYSGADFNRFWQSGLRDGIIGSAAAEEAPAGADPFAELEPEPPPSDAKPDTLWALFRPDSRVGDGRWANNPWLQEIPKSMTMLVWDNAAIMAPDTAKRLGLSNNDVVRLTLRGRSVEAAVWIDLGQHPSAVVLHLGYGRENGGLADGQGFDAYRIRPSDERWNVPGLQVEKLGRKYNLVTTQEHHAMHGRHLAMHGKLKEFRENPEFIHEKLHAPKPGESLYPAWQTGDYEWGMTIDLNVCTGCRACVAACQAENNIPVVGKQQCEARREMHWIRVDRYYHGDPEKPEMIHQPVPCMHCENAPCEVVCPVAATVHGNGGLNEMVYNRCVGTRYCSNNCPYKVRRFNFLDYRKEETPRHRDTRALQHNPDVTVRMRGVMEKCTYCVQRISQARIAAKKENRRIRDGEVVPACAQSCPAEAIVFGDVTDPESKVSQLKRSPLNYSLLAELNTRPRTTYLAQLKNRKGEA